MRPSRAMCSRQAGVGATLRTIAAHGSRGFYEGEVAADMVATLRARGGLQTEADFAARPHRRRVRRADPGRLARLRGLAVSAQRVRPAGAHAARHPGRVRHRVRPALPRAPAPPYRGCPPGLPRPRRASWPTRRTLRCRSSACSAPPTSALCTTASTRHGPWTCRAPGEASAAAASRHSLSLRGGPRRQRVLVHQFAVQELRLRHPGRATAA